MKPNSSAEEGKKWNPYKSGPHPVKPPSIYPSPQNRILQVIFDNSSSSHLLFKSSSSVVSPQKSLSNPLLSISVCIAQGPGNFISHLDFYTSFLTGLHPQSVVLLQSILHSHPQVNFLKPSLIFHLPHTIYNSSMATIDSMFVTPKFKCEILMLTVLIVGGGSFER